jgi:hypothetical protein
MKVLYAGSYGCTQHSFSELTEWNGIAKLSPEGGIEVS